VGILINKNFSTQPAGIWANLVYLTPERRAAMLAPTLTLRVHRTGRAAWGIVHSADLNSAGTLARGGGAMKPSPEPPADLPPDLKRAAHQAVLRTNSLPPPPSYDSHYWLEERLAIANCAVWKASRRYRRRKRKSLVAFATERAVWAIVDEWRHLRRQWRGLVAMPVDEEMGEEMEIEDPMAQAEIEAHALCCMVREAMKQLSAEEQVVLDLYYGEDMSERAIALLLGRSKSWVHRRLESALARLRAILGVQREGGI